MTGPSDDLDLREQFARLRRDQRQQAPAFARATTPRPTPRHAPQSVALALAIVVTLLLSVVLFPKDVSPNVLIDLRTSRWTAPTDFLLNVPGDWMLRDLPRVWVPTSEQIDSIFHRRPSS